MSTDNQTPATSSNNFNAIFEAASTDYHRVTGKRLDTHPFAAQLDSCNSPEAVSNILRSQAQAFSKFRKGDEKLMKWLDPTVHILFTFSGTLGEGIGLPFSPAKTIFTGIGVLLAAVRDVAASHDSLMQLFERIHFFVQRLKSYTGIPLTNELTELLGKIMSQMLSVLALSTKVMAERRMKKFLKRLAGRTNVEDALLQLDFLTKEESLMAAARNLEVVDAVKLLVEDIDDRVQVIEGVARSVDQNVKVTKDRTDELERKRLRGKLQKWLAPPDPSINHNNACKTQHDGTARWFTQGSTFREWKDKGSLLWIRGNPGAGKSILCSAIIQDIKNMREERSALIAYYYFDYKDTLKRDVRGLLTSLLCQLSDDSDRCMEVLHRLYISCRDGSERPSDSALAECLQDVLKLPGQVPVFMIIDALDECPTTTGTPSAREEMLDFVEDLVGSNHSNLFICITSRPEQDIQTVLNPLTSGSRRVALHEESGQREDINNYVRSFVYTDRIMRRWREEDKELVINTLSERAGGMFRWVFCQLDTLRRCFPPSIRKTLNELPTTLDDTYERTLQGIPRERRQYAHRLFQCLVAAARPLHVEELAEIFAIEFGLGVAQNFMEGWRPDNAEEAVLSACSTLISLIDDADSKVVQFSHFSVKEFLTSDRLRISKDENIREYHIPLDVAHTVLAQACLTVLLQFDKHTDRKQITKFPLALYSARHWFDHANYKDVDLRVQDAVELLFNPSKPYLAAWVWVVDIDGGESMVDEHPSPPKAAALYYAASCGLSRVVKYLISTHAEDVNVKCGTRGSPLHAASRWGHINSVSVLLDHGADVKMTNEVGRTPLAEAYDGKHMEVMQLLLERGADADVQYDPYGLLTHDAAFTGQVEAMRLLLQHNVDVNATSMYDYSVLHWAASQGHTKVVKLLLEHGANINAQSGFGTSLFRALDGLHYEAVRLLAEHGADVRIQGRDMTPYQLATQQGSAEIAQLLLEYEHSILSLCFHSGFHKGLFMQKL